jgi:hypothetical protein
MNLVHYFMVGAAALAAGLPSLEAALPPAATPWIKGVTAIAVLVVAVCGAVSGPVTTKSGAAAMAAKS